MDLRAKEDLRQLDIMKTGNGMLGTIVAQWYDYRAIARGRDIVRRFPEIGL